jgi:hypothetical protein
MLAEKFLLVLETLICHAADSEPAQHPDGAPRVKSRERHILIKLPEAK